MTAPLIRLIDFLIFMFILRGRDKGNPYANTRRRQNA